MKLRVKFRKFGPVRFIGHLDVMRFFQKAVRRAGIDVAYTSGFSPHQIMSFASPLGVGLTSNGEYMDIEVNSTAFLYPDPSGSEEPHTAAQEDMKAYCSCVMERLNKVSVSGIEIISVTVLPADAENAMASVAAAAYTVRFREERVPRADISAGLQRFLEKEHIFILKKTKKSTREIDLRPGIYQLTWSGSAFSMLLDASSSGNIKPVQVVEALLADCGETLQENALLIAREDVYTNIGTKEQPKLIPLGEVV